MIDPWFIRFESISSVLALTITAADIKFLSAGLFGVVLGWNLYFINRYRKDVVLGDLASVVGAIGGAAVLALFGSGTEPSPAYGIGLAVGFSPTSSCYSSWLHVRRTSTLIGSLTVVTPIRKALLSDRLLALSLAPWRTIPTSNLGGLGIDRRPNEIQ